MDFNLIGFGKDLYHIRKDLKLSLEEASFLAQISEKTISRVEYGKNKISMSTLDKLSCAYKRDLFNIYNKHLEDPKKIFDNLIIDSEKKLNIEDASGIQININKLQKLPSKIFTSYEQLYIKNYIKLLEATYIDVEYKDRKKSINLLLKFIKSQIYGFNVKNYKDFNFSPMEIRILMNLSTMGYKSYKSENLFEILCYLLSISPKDNSIYPSLILNLSTIYHNKNNYKESLNLVEYGIEYSIYNNTQDTLPQLFFRKFTCELNLGIKNYRNSLSKAILLAEINNNDYLKNIFIKNAEKIYSVSF